MSHLFEDQDGFQYRERIEDNEKLKKYSKGVASPIYTPREGGAKSVYACFDHSRYQQLMRKIDASNVKEEEKMFLRLAATRHIVFNYENIADYYAIADKEMQELMEDSALVIVDFGKAIEEGFVVLNDKMLRLYESEIKATDN